MRIAILSDIHANLEALETALTYIGENNVDKIFCLGDIVGYGPNPNECVELIADNCEQVIIGNHDHAVLGLTSIEYFNDFAKISTAWTAKNISTKNREYLANLPFKYQNEDVYCLVHSTPSEPAQWHYILSESDAYNEFNHFKQHVCFIGHSHFPIVFSKKGFSRERKLKLEKRNKYIVNVGSIGQPRDGNPKTCFCIYNPDKNMVEYVRLEYEISKTRDKIIKEGLPVFLADRLTRGY
jgi:predicted phosphodiesterase